MAISEVRMIDATGEPVQVVIIKDRIWINVNGVCYFRAYRCPELVVEDQRKVVEEETS